MSIDRRGRTQGDYRLPYRWHFDSVAEAEALARKVLPRAMYLRLNSGAGESRTMRANGQAYGDVTFRPRAATVPPIRATSTTILGVPITAPVLLAPVGALRLQHPEGAAAAVDAAGQFGTICAISPASGHSFDELASRSGATPLWSQVTTAIGGRDGAEKQIATVHDLGYHALVVTVDSALRPKVPPIRLNTRTVVGFAPDLIRHPRWTAKFVRDGMRLGVANRAVGATPDPDARPLAWDDLRWMSELWRGPIVVKGILTADDARRAVDLGAAAIVVSNHGGLTLDDVPATLSVLREVVEAVNGQVQVLIDGGIRSGNDVVKAVALGADAVLVGRAYVMGLAAGGAAGVGRVLDILQDDIQRALAFLGCASIDEVDLSHVRIPADWASIRSELN
ncbi:alpha-hydroxy acid oxidase [Rhodococcus jostii]|uniref:L-lactate dehydrogenase (Cytochrome) n=1 Tax=Rhodococcus jostii TaxID=132919 RepID=A0A1H4IM06_RHOJO|nr:alpha-hydroxy acid oxidase [Rhodococcus jostii]SEB34905.1 L-lactate dehydrogenase (cytochrome) [Rhodococcus jostii]